MRQFTCPKAVTHPSTNRARCRATALIETNALPLHQTANQIQPRNSYGAEPEAERESDGSSVVAARRRPCMPARPAFSQNIQPSASPGPTAGIPVPHRDATMFHNVQPWPPPLEYVIHPELRTEHICPSSSASLLSLPARQCDISAAVIQRDSHRRYIRNSFVY